MTSAYALITVGSAASPSEQTEREGNRRRQRRGPIRWPLEVAAGVLAIVVVAALTLPHLRTAPPPGPSGAAGVVPWASLAAPDVTQPFTKPGVRACKAGVLAFDVHAQASYIGAGPANTSFWEVSVTNVGLAQCFVGPTMDVTFTTAQGPLQISPERWGGDIVYLGHGERAVGEIDTFPCAEPRIAGMTISPGPGLGSVDVDPGPAGGFGAPCPARPQTYMVELRADTTQGGYAALTQTSIDAPAMAHPGDHLRFLVTIENRPAPRLGIGPDPSPSPLAFSPCPTYHMELEGVERTFHTYQLNCSEAVTIAPFQSEKFEMFIDVPRVAPPGPAVLRWAIDGSPLQWEADGVYLPIQA